MEPIAHDTGDLGDVLFLSRTRGGFLGRRAHRLVYFIEAQVAYHKEQLRWACRVLLGQARPEWEAGDVLSGFALRDQARVRISALDLERHASEWSRLVPASPGMRAAVIYILAGKYGLSADDHPQIGRALSLDADDVREAYEREYGVPLGDVLRRGAVASAAPVPAPPEDPAAEDRLAADAAWLFVPGGEAVTRQGEPMDSLYVVASGRLRTDPAAAFPAVRREYATGDVLGDASIFAGVEWRSTVYAARDSELVRLSRAALERLLRSYPQQGLEVMQALVARSAAGAREHRSSALTIALLPLGDGVNLAAFAEPLVDALAAQGPALSLEARRVDDAVTAGASAAQPGDDLDGMVAAWLSQQEAQHRFVLYQADHTLSAWTERCLRQADRVVLVAQAGSDPAPRAVEQGLNARTEVHLVLLHPADATRPSGTAAWLAPRNLHAHHHVRLGVAADLRRVAHLLSGNAVGLVLGGGGARGFVHVGALRALKENGITPDVIGGTSIGAVMGGLAALGWTVDEILGLGERFGRRGALLDFTLPLMSLMATRKITALLRSVCAEAKIEDLWQPFFCLSTNLTQGGCVIHRTGPLWEAMRASIALPGIFSPILHDGDVLVDGGVLNNLPLDVMRDLCEDGTVIGVQASPPSGGFGKYIFEQGLSGWQILWRRLNPLRASPSVPSIVSILLRSVEVKDVAGARRDPLAEQADILIQPDTSSFRLLDFSAYRALADVGYQAARDALRVVRHLG